VNSYNSVCGVICELTDTYKLQHYVLRLQVVLQHSEPNSPSIVSVNNPLTTPVYLCWTF